MAANYDAIVIPEAAAFQIPVDWIYAVIGTESGDLSAMTFNDDVAATWEPTVGEYSWGPMQILESTARTMGFTGNASDLANPGTSMPFAIAYLAQLAGQDGPDFRNVYSAYNSGNPNAWQTAGSQVAANVARAVEWLDYFQSQVPSGPGGSILTYALGVALLYLGYQYYEGHRR